MGISWGFNAIHQPNPHGSFRGYVGPKLNRSATRVFGVSRVEGGLELWGSNWTFSGPTANTILYIYIIVIIIISQWHVGMGKESNTLVSTDFGHLLYPPFSLSGYPSFLQLKSPNFHGARSRGVPWPTQTCLKHSVCYIPPLLLG